MFEFFALVIAIVAFIFARKAFNQIDALRARLDALEAAAPRVAATPVAPPPVPAYETPIAPLAADEISTETTEEAAPIPSASPPPIPDIPAPAPQPGPGFEERIGTRWVVWVGGLTLALGGFFLVRYSIEQGLLGPGVRVLLGGLFALALLAAGEWTRRKESLAAIEPLPIANIPAVLTAAGTAVAFATVYAAYALYDFLVPATAFILLGMVALGTLAAALLHGPALAGLGIAAAFATPILVSSETAGFLGAVSLSRRRHRRRLRPRAHPAVALACGHDHRARDAVDLPLPAMRAVDGRPARLPRHRRIYPRGVAGGMRIHVRTAGGARPHRADLVRRARGLSARRDDDRAEQFSRRHRHDRVCVAGGRHLVRRMAHRRRHRRDRRSRGVRLHRVCRMGDTRQPGHAGAARRTPARHRPERHRRLGLRASDHRGDLRGRLRRRRVSGARPLRQRHRAGGMVGLRRVHAAGAADRAVCPHRASRSLDPVRDSRRRARRSLRCCNGKLEQTRSPAGIADLDRAVRHRHAGCDRAGADLRAGKRLADDCACADVARHGVDFDAAADSVPALARGDPRRHRGGAHRVRAAHRRRRRRRHADLQLAAVGLWHPGAVVLGRQHPAAPPRRRRAAAHGGGGGDPVHGAAGIHGNPPCGQMAATCIGTSPSLTEIALQVCVALAMAIGLERLRIRTQSVVHNAAADPADRFCRTGVRLRTADP